MGWKGSETPRNHKAEVENPCERCVNRSQHRARESDWLLARQTQHQHLSSSPSAGYLLLTAFRCQFVLQWHLHLSLSSPPQINVILPESTLQDVTYAGDLSEAFPEGAQPTASFGTINSNFQPLHSIRLGDTEEEWRPPTFIGEESEKGYLSKCQLGISEWLLFPAAITSYFWQIRSNSS